MIVKLKIDIQGCAKLFNGLVLVEIHFSYLTLRHRSSIKIFSMARPLPSMVKEIS
jgi:hypothetical protein